MAPSRAKEAAVFRSVRRTCYAGLDSVAFREEATRRIAELIPFDAHNFATIDPDTGLFTHGVAEGIPARVNLAWQQYLYPFEVAAEIIDLARKGEWVTTAASVAVTDLLRPEGLVYDMRSILSGGSDPWGFVCFLREAATGAFTEEEASFMRRVAPHLAQGLLTGVLRDRVAEGGSLEANGGEGEGAGETELGAGVLVLDQPGRIRTRNPAAAAYLHDLEDVGRGDDVIPYGVTSAVSQMVRRHGLASSDPSMPLGGELRVQGRSGRWYTIRASLAEPDESGAYATIVLIDPARPADVALILTRLYGLTRREREALALAAKGRSTKEIARQLGISPYTVQEHLGNACDKVGVRTRRELLAKLFFDGYAPRLAS